jgi:hypothetical protein
MVLSGNDIRACLTYVLYWVHPTSFACHEFDQLQAEPDCFAQISYMAGHHGSFALYFEPGADLF